LVYTGKLTFDLEFASRDELVRAVTIESVLTSEPASLKITLATAGNQVLHEATFQLDRDRPIEIESAVPGGGRASRLRLELSSATPVHAWLTDVRVQGQTPELERYINEKLRFPAPRSRAAR
jgi:hypothetical protein